MKTSVLVVKSLLIGMVIVVISAAGYINNDATEHDGGVKSGASSGHISKIGPSTADGLIGEVVQSGRSVGRDHDEVRRVRHHTYRSDRSTTPSTA